MNDIIGWTIKAISLIFNLFRNRIKLANVWKSINAAKTYRNEYYTVNNNDHFW